MGEKAVKGVPRREKWGQEELREFGGEAFFKGGKESLINDGRIRSTTV